MAGAAETAKRVLEADEAVLYGIFGVIGGSGYFPPREFLNEFLMRGHDPCDQDGRMPGWTPFVLSPREYDEVKAWWVSGHAGTVVSELGVGCWDDWVQVILNPEDWGFPNGLPDPAEPSSGPEPAASDRPAAWAVWRIDDNANTFLVRGGLGRDEAERLAAEYTARGHKQTYWVEPEASADPSIAPDPARGEGS